MSKRLVIIGGVAAGATAAARAKRLDPGAEVTVIEAGRYVSFANCGLPYHVSGDIERRGALLLQTPEGFKARYGVSALIKTKATSIDRQARTVSVSGPEGESTLPYDALILAQGASPVLPPIKGIEAGHVFRLWTIPDMDAIQSFIAERSPRTALVIGGGFIGLEAAEAFAARGLSTTVVEAFEHPMPPADPEFGELIKRAFAAGGVSMVTGRTVSAIGADTATLDDGSVLRADIVLVSAGARPNVELAKAAGLAVGRTGGLLVDETLRTSDPFIWAAGDMIEIRNRVSGSPTRVPLAGPANRQGRIAATNALGGSMRYDGSSGTSVFKAMDSTFAMTGLSEKAAKAQGLSAAAVTVHRYHHVSYYPGATELSLKLVYERGSGRILGVQAFGKDGVDKRVDAAAAALAGKLTIDELAELDLAYAPPYGAANDPLNVAAFAAQNAESGYAPTVSAEEAVRRWRAGEASLVDLRTVGDRRRLDLPASVAMPLDELDWRLDELPDGPLLLVSRAGYESHIALRKLTGLGRKDAYNVSGGALSLDLVPELTKGRKL